MPQSKSITIYAMSQKGFAVVKTLSQKNMLTKDDLIVIGRDKNVPNDFGNDLVELCEKNNIPFQERKDHKEASTDYLLAIGWRWMLPSIQNLIILHDSLLPKYRGFLPLVSALMNKETTIGVTALFANDYYDSGDIISQSKTDIQYPIKIQKLINIVEKNYQKLAVDIVKKIKNGESLTGTPQNHEEATYSLWRDDDDYKIDWSQSAEYIQRFIHAVGPPYLGASSTIKDQTVRIMDAEIFPDKIVVNRDPGKIIFLENKKPVVVCGTGLLKLSNIQDEQGESILPLKSFRTRFK